MNKKEITLKNFKYCIFDMDGTLLDSMSGWHNLGRDYLMLKGFNSPEDLNDTIEHMSMIEAANYFIQAFKLKISPEKIIEEVKSLIEDKYKYEFQLKPYVKDYLDLLKSQDVKMCVVTASPVKLAKLALERNEIIDYFSFLLSCDEVKLGKDKPDIFYMAKKKLCAHESEIAVFDDADFALITSKEAGFYTVGVYDDFYKKERKNLELICDKYIESFKELIY